ncbi:uncharacterized protein OCT59_007563 [Rhizophagus irregularis]|uniref:uncharacterized protein n=1 Tax=Rhizophagus irregularis TaxID=588596 RepID=UPI0019EDC68C|nr:hypothetical protein OCT59_007563 [Rhizophagus irregularis]GBC33393.2 hypothetical protein GLOIN_2v1582480 [Rhizophagus irregularis DAOM 181602=DAOM 197198]
MEAKMDNDNLNLHVKPMDSSTKNGMDAKRDLGVHRKNGGKEQKGTESIQQHSSSVQDKPPYFQQSQWTSEANDIGGERNHNNYSNSIECCLLFVHDQSMPIKENSKEKDKEKSQKILSETGEISLSAPRANLPMDDCNGTQTRQSTSSNQRFLEIKPGKDHQFCIWCVSYSLQSERQAKFMCTPERERPTPSSPGSARKCYPETRDLGVRELRGDECLDFFMLVETRSPNKDSNNISTQQRNKGTMQQLQSYPELVATLKNDRKFHDFYEHTDGWLIDQENKEHFNEKYGITNIHPLYVDHSGMVVSFLDDRGILFAWCEMTREMDIWGINKMEGIANYLYHPEKVCVIMNDGKLVTRVELVRSVEEERVKEKLAKEKLVEEIREKNREKRLAKKKRLAEEK